MNIVSTPEIYLHEWASFTTKDFPENRDAGPGDEVRIITTDFEDRSHAVDILWPHESYLEVYRRAHLEMVEVHRPLAKGGEPYPWASERHVAPWAIYVLRPIEVEHNGVISVTAAEKSAASQRRKNRR